MTYPRSFSHIGISVTDLDKAVEFYTKTLGWYVIMPQQSSLQTIRPSASCAMTCSGTAGGRFALPIYPLEIVLVSNCLSSRTPSGPRTISSIGKPECFTFVSKTRMWKDSQRRLLKTGESRGCRYANIIPVKSLTGWSIAKTPLAISSKSIRTAMN